MKTIQVPTYEASTDANKALMCMPHSPIQRQP